MKNWRSTLVSTKASVRDSIERIDASSLMIALVVGEDDHLAGIVTDGDIRRFILRGDALDTSVTAVMNPAPKTVSQAHTREEVVSLMRKWRIFQVPVVDDAGRIVGLELMEDLLNPEALPNRVVMMAGGLGSRLRPLTDDCPKPMLKVAGKPVLETAIENLAAFGFRSFDLAVNYRADMIEDYFGDGSRLGVDIRYIHEPKRMGTAGALSLLPERPQEPILVMNADLLTKLNFDRLLTFHTEHAAKATMCVREYDIQIPYGVVQTEGHLLTGITEKPVHRYFVNAGVYVIEPTALDLIPDDTFYDMPTLFTALREAGHETAAFPVREYWLDIGRLSDLERAHVEFGEVFA